jgi:FAD/FMN-containing dehydrogenase
LLTLIDLLLRKETTVDHNPATSRAHAELDALRSRITGDVIGERDDGFDAARQAFMLTLDQRPAIVALPESADDVLEIVRFARSIGLRIAPQSTGHGASPLEDLGDAILLKTSRMRSAEIDPDARTARVEAGAQWQDVAVPAAEHGLAALAGTAPNVGVLGYTLGGGIGWLARKYGLSANSVVAAEIVLPDGTLVRADKTTEPDLFWAVRGGGGGMGVLTAIEIALYPVRELYAGVLFFPIERSAEVLHAWREWTESVPDEVTSLGRIVQFPPIPDVPEPVRGKSFVLVEAAYLGPEREGAAVIRPLRDLGPTMDTFAMMPPPGLGALHMDPPEPVPARGDGMLLADAPAGAIDAVVGVAGPDSGSPLLSIELRHLGGALARATDAGPQTKIAGSCAVFAVGIAPTPEMGEAVGAHLRVVKDALRPWRAEYDFFNLCDSPADGDAVFPPDSYSRLRQIKARYDPDESIISAHPVRPAA